MARKTLPFKAAIVGQEYYYDCGPATVQNITSSRMSLTEQQLIREMGTTTNGTNYVGLLERSLTKHLKVPYKSVYIGGNDATAVQREQFWKDLVRSVDGGFGVAMNWVAPPGNYPRGVNGSSSPSYGGGTIYHYVAAMGYEERNGERFVFVVDSGFRPNSYWVTLKQAASLIAGKGYAFANVAALVAKPSAADSELTKRYPSRSKYRANDNPVDTLAGFILNIDARIHEAYTEARRG